MSVVPAFESVAVIGDNARLIAEICSLFTRSNKYVPVLDAPRMTRDDWTNEVIRRRNAIVMAQSKRVVLADVSAEVAKHLTHRWPADMFVTANSIGEAATTLRGWTKARTDSLHWGSCNLGVGLLLARRSKKVLDTSEAAVSPLITFVPGKSNLLIACEKGESLAEIAASNLAYATGAAFLIFPQLPKNEHDEWLDEVYALESGGDISGRFAEIRERARRWLPEFDFSKYRQVLFVTDDFPWGIATPECPTTHMFSYPDFGRSVVEGIWASSNPTRSARNALLVDPHQVAGSEIRTTAEALHKNGTMVRIQSGLRATVNQVQMLIETLPFDVIVLSTHAGDVSGDRVTYEYTDSEGLRRRFVIDEAVGFGYDPITDKVSVQQYERFHELDGVNWMDSTAKKNLYVGTAVLSWTKLGDLIERQKYKVASHPIQRVAGSMGLKMNDNVWIPMIHGLAPNAAPVIVNNACSSWHQLSQRFTYAGARAYVGTLFPVTDVEAQEVGAHLFVNHLGRALPEALWTSQNAVYQGVGRRPYAMVGLPFCSIRPNTTNPVPHLVKSYKDAIDEYERKKAKNSAEDVKENSERYMQFLVEDYQDFKRHIRL